MEFHDKEFPDQGNRTESASRIVAIRLTHEKAEAATESVAIIPIEFGDLPLAAQVQTICEDNVEYIDINESQLAFEVTGEGVRDIVFVHGYLSRATEGQYRGLKRELSREFRIFCLDMRGHGGSAGVGERVTLGQCTEDIISFVRQVGLSRPLYIGHSMGGYLGLAAAAKAPRLFSAMALLTPASSKGIQLESEQVEQMMSLRADPAQLDDFNRLSYVREVSQEDLDQLRNDSLLVSDSVHERWMREEWSNINISTSLPDLRIPVLFVNGMKDVVINPEDQHADAMSIPNAKEVIFANEGHMFPMEAPEKCAGEIAHFFGSLGSFSETRL